MIVLGHTMHEWGRVLIQSFAIGILIVLVGNFLGRKKRAR